VFKSGAENADNRSVWYDDQRDAHRQIYSGDETIEYAFMGTDSDASDNRWLRAVMQEEQSRYFLGTSPGRYQPIMPTFQFDGRECGGVLREADAPASELVEGSPFQVFADAPHASPHEPLTLRRQRWLLRFQPAMV
jgi:hypothetical protein